MIVPFEPHHLTQLLLQPAQAMMQPTMADPAYGESLCAAGPAYSLVVNGEVLACMGLVKQWDERAIAWGLIGASAGPFMLRIHRAVLATMRLHRFRRIETAVLCGFPAAQRWVQRLGFVREGRMLAYTPDGSDCDLYAIVRV